MVDFFGEFEQSEREPVQFRVYEEHVVDSPRVGSGSVGREAIVSAELLGGGEGEETIDGFGDGRVFGAEEGWGWFRK